MQNGIVLSSASPKHGGDTLKGCLVNKRHKQDLGQAIWRQGRCWVAKELQDTPGLC